ncbi:hypothetical protein FQN50_009764 [Emmonsiellopsis sp. PD_5]|nr:hypothetical protein FQN50_009764 [Emmonsiellopsis sp. PD_5]
MDTTQLPPTMSSDMGLPSSGQGDYTRYGNPFAQTSDLPTSSADRGQSPNDEAFWAEFELARRQILEQSIYKSATRDENDDQQTKPMTKRRKITKKVTKPTVKRNTGGNRLKIHRAGLEPLSKP